MKFNEVFSMAKTDRKKMFYLIVLAIVAMLLFLLSGSGGGKQAPSQETERQGETKTASDMMTETESQLEAVLSKIHGVGRVEVAIEWEGDTEKDYAYNEETSQRTNDGEGGSEEITTRREMVLLNGDASPIVTGEALPQVVGVIVVAEGAYRAEVRESLAKVVSTYLGIGANRIEITAMEAGS